MAGPHEVELMFCEKPQLYASFIRMVRQHCDTPIQVRNIHAQPGIDRSVLWTFLAETVAHDAVFKAAHTVLILTDNRPFHQISHIAPVFRMLYERCQIEGEERWAALFVQATDTNSLLNVHYVWAGPYVLEGLMYLYPGKHYILLDHDAAPTALWEVADLQRLSQEVFGYAPLIHCVSEHASTINAGLVIVPSAAANHRQGTAGTLQNVLDTHWTELNDLFAHRADLSQRPAGYQHLLRRWQTDHSIQHHLSMRCLRQPGKW